MNSPIVRTVVVSAPEPDIAQRSKRILRFRDGLLEANEPVTDRLFAGATSRKG